ncbi:MAG: DUF3604 domain-containing protein [bacterium]
MGYNLYWGDSHTNIHTDHMDTIDKTYDFAREILDFFPVAYYPFYYYEKDGLGIETCSHKKEFDQDWEKIKEMVKKYNNPGHFITFPGYEWHGNRRYYGDHNVFYLEEDKPLTDIQDVKELYNFLKKNSGIAIPHHTGYKVRERGKDWSYFDPEVSPLAEIYSAHGSSEGSNTPFNLDNNKSMGPRSTSGCIQEGLKKGYKFGIIASGDSHFRIPGVWGRGLMGVYAEKLTRESLWEAFKSRRTIAITGDRIKAKLLTDNGFMGEEVADASPEFKVIAEGSGYIDRIDLLKNNQILDAYVAKNIKNDSKNEFSKFKLRLSFGWGPKDYFENLWNNWQGKIRIDNGEILEVEKAFTHWDQKVDRLKENEYTWKLKSKAREYRQQLIFTFKAKSSSSITIECNGKEIKFSLAEGLKKSQIIPYISQAETQIVKEFGLKREEIENPDVFYHQAYKMKIHQVVPESAYRKEVTFKDLEVKGKNYYYARIYQKNGQMAWTSPIWVR